MVRIERSCPIPPSLAAGKSWKEADVTGTLARDFREKCYLCEKNELVPGQVDHLKPRQSYPDLSFAWDNLFWCCPHCNGMKSNRQGVLDCCKCEPELLLQQEVDDAGVHVTALKPEADITAQLIYDCFEKRNTGIRIQSCNTLLKILRRTMTVLYNTLAAYEAHRSEGDLAALRGMLDRSHRFAGFTRAYVRQRLWRWPELGRYVALEPEEG